MRTKRLLAYLMVAILTLSIVIAYFPTVKALETIYIQPDGTVNPASAPIQHVGNIYSLTGNIVSDGAGIVIQKSGIVLDGLSFSIQGQGSSSGVILSDVNGVTVRNLKVKDFAIGIQVGTGYNGPELMNNVIVSNEIVENNQGIALYENKYTTIEENLIQSNAIGIVTLEQTLLSNIKKNQIISNGEGINHGYEGHAWLNATIEKNEISNNNGYAISFLAYHSGGSYNTITENNITGNGGGVNFEIGCGGNIISSNNFRLNKGPAVSFNDGSDGNKITDNIIEANAAGILLAMNTFFGDEGNVGNNQIVRNTIKDNVEYGIQLVGASSNIIAQNSIINNTYGVILDCGEWATPEFPNTGYSNYNTVYDNTIADNLQFGVKCSNCTGNVLYHNSFSSNGQQVFSEYSTGIWDNGYPSGGNLWSDYTGVDSDGDGIGDTPYIIDQTNQDRYPLVDSSAPSFSDGFESGSFSSWIGTAGTTGETSSISTYRPHHGAYSARFTSNGGGGYESAYSYQALDASEVYARGYFYASQSGIRERNDRFFFLILNAGSNGLAYAGWRQTSAGLRWCLTIRDGTSYVDLFSSSAPSTGRWYSVELHWTKGVNGLVEMWVDGNLVCQTSKNTDAFGDATQVRVGLAEIYSCRSTVVYADCITVAESYVGTEAVPDITRPTVSSVSVYPTSFRPRSGQTTRLSYSLSEDCKVTVRIYSRSGVLVRTLLNDEVQSDGSQSVVWNGRSSSGSIVPRGTYTIRLYVTDLAGNNAATYPITRTVTVR